LQGATLKLLAPIASVISVRFVRDALEREVNEAIAKIPIDRHKVITTHDAFGYFGETGADAELWLVDMRIALYRGVLRLVYWRRSVSYQ
jgi:hypothetical protein